jgi:predicted phage terminase large subunit-like protein
MENLETRIRWLTADEFAELLQTIPKADLPEVLRLRFRWHRDEFARTCWPERFELPFNPCHMSLLGDERLAFDKRATRREAKAAPRGLGKSTISSFVDPIHGIVYGLERLIIVMTAVTDLAVELVDDIRNAFEDIEKGALHELYGPFHVVGGKTDFVVTTARGFSCRVVAKSFLQQVRGIKYRGDRPTMFIIDDGERSDRVRSADQRAITWKYLSDDVLKAGRKQGGTEYRVRGTVLHPDSMLATLMASPGWDSERWQSIITWPDRSDLWDECGQIWKDLSNPTRRVDALAFYEQHRAEMDAGAEVLDPIAEPIFALYEIIWAEGLSSFLREKQNEPRDPSSSYFDSSKFKRCMVEGPPGREIITAADGRKVALRDCRRLAYWDPIPGDELRALGDEGGSGAGDYAAIATLARDPLGYRYVLNVWMHRRKDSEQLEALWKEKERWGFDRAALEAVNFARLMGRDFRRVQSERKANGLPWQLVLDEDVPQGPKEDRIAALEVGLENGWIQFSQHVKPEVFGQFDDFPDADHDDAADAIAGADRCLGGTNSLVGQERIY